MRLTALPQYKRDSARFIEITGVLFRYGFAQHLDRIEPEFVKRWLGHESVAEIAAQPIGGRIRGACEELGPTFVKLGQVLSTRPDVVPPAIANELRALQAGTTPDPPEEVRATVEEELGGTLESLFASFELEALASASIGQVHRATLPDGTDVVVKVRHTGIEQRIQDDVDILLGLAGFLEGHDETLRSIQLESVVEDAWRTLRQELDFRRELRNLVAVRAAFADREEIHFPAPYPEHSTRRVLTMERLDGVSVADTESLQRQHHDLAQLARVGAHVFLDMVFRDGTFHADPHPGNILVLRDGRLALIDFGMVGRVDEELRGDLLELVVGFVRSDQREILRAVRRVGALPGDVDESALRRDIAEFHSDLRATPIREMDVGSLLDQFTTILRRHRILLPPAVSMLVKLLVMLEGTSRHLDPRFSLMEVLEPYCERLIAKRMSPTARARRAYETSREWLRLAERLPTVLDQAASRIERGQVEVDMVHRGLEETVDRLVSGLLCAAMLVGGAILWAAEAPPIAWGFPVVGVAATGIALLHGVRLLKQIGGRAR